MKKILAFFQIPPSVREDFWDHALARNRISLLVICVMIFGMELYNMARVLFLSRSGLGTLNNRIYFSMYCGLFLGAAAYLVLWRLLRKRSRRARWAVQYGGVLCCLLWHACLNAYDFAANPPAQISVYITAVLGLSVFILMPSFYSFLSYGLGYVTFVALSWGCVPAGDMLNLTLTTVVALAISLTRGHNGAVVISQRREIEDMNRSLHLLLQKDPLTELLNRRAFQECVELHLRAGEEVALVMVDLDDFKGVNDRFGHPCGDHVLQQAADKLREVFPEAVGVGRVGGDEFAVALEAAGPAQLEEAARRLVEEVSRIRWREQDVGACCSVGACAAGNIPFAALYQQADRALYQAKAQGKGRWILQVPEEGAPLQPSASL